MSAKIDLWVWWNFNWIDLLGKNDFFVSLHSQEACQEILRIWTDITMGKMVIIWSNVEFAVSPKLISIKWTNNQGTSMSLYIHKSYNFIPYIGDNKTKTQSNLINYLQFFYIFLALLLKITYNTNIYHTVLVPNSTGLLFNIVHILDECSKLNKFRISNRWILKCVWCVCMCHLVLEPHRMNYFIQIQVSILCHKWEKIPMNDFI